MPETAPVPTPERKPAWRAAAARPIVSSAEPVRPTTRSWLAAVEALQAVWPLPLEDARRETTHAIAYASSQHTKWFWDGVSDWQADQ